MNIISVKDRIKIQSHLAEIWKILYANGLEDLEAQRTPTSRQKLRMSELLIRYNKSYVKPNNGFRISVSDNKSCWREIEFKNSLEEIEETKRRDELREKYYAIRKRIEDRKEARRKALAEEHHVAYWHKYFMTPYWSNGYTDIHYSKQNDEGTFTYVGPRPDGFVYWLFHSANFDGKKFTAEAREKFMKKYGLDKEFDVSTGHRIEIMNDSIPEKAEDKSKKVKDYLRKKFNDGSWKDEAMNLVPDDPAQSVYDYLDVVREFIHQQEDFDLHGVALYSINEERTKAHDKMLEDFNLNGNDEKSDIARDVTKTFDFVGEYKFIHGRMKTVFWSEREAALKLAYALEVVLKENS